MKKLVAIVLAVLFVASLAFMNIDKISPASEGPSYSHMLPVPPPPPPQPRGI